MIPVMPAYVDTIDDNNEVHHERIITMILTVCKCFSVLHTP